MSSRVYESEAGNITMALVGDAMLARSLKPFREPEYLALVDMLRAADVSFANLETTVRTAREGVPNFTQGTPMSTPPALLEDLRWMGIDIVSLANNHATDYGVSGLLASMAHLEAANIPFSGAGRTLMQARRPAYFDSPAGRVALVSATSFYRPWNRASDARSDADGRPGISPLGFSSAYSVDEASLRALKRISDELGMTQERARHRSQFYSASEVPAEDADVAMMLGSRFVRGDKFGVSTKVDKGDAEGILRWIREARQQADWVIFSFHNHAFGDGGRLTAPTDVELEETAAFAIDFAHAAVDAGAHVVAGHGPHLTMGVEVYRDAPIFYSLGNFLFQNETIDAFPSEAYGRFGLAGDATPSQFLNARTGNDTRGFPASPEFWEACMARCEFERGRLEGVRIVPLDLGYGRPRGQRGRPVLARGESAERILARIIDRSKPFGTRLSVVDGCAVLGAG